MKLKMDYTGDRKGFNLAIDMDINIEEDAEALGYATSVIFEAAQRLSELMKKANPKYLERLAKGVDFSVQEMNRELPLNPHYPFTTFCLTDE